jgi:hypothetical protein
MNTQLFPLRIRTIIVITSLITLLLAGVGWSGNADAAGLALTADSASAFNTGFSYQGLLTDGSGAANGLYDFRFELLAEGDLVGAEYIAENVQVTNGLFSTTVAITGSGIWNGQRRFLRVAARADGETDFVVIGAPVEIQPTPYAFYARQANSALTADEAAVAAGLTSGKTTEIQVGTFAMAESDGANTLAFATKATGHLEVKRPAGVGSAFVYIPVDVPAQILGMPQKLTMMSFCYSGAADNAVGVLAGIEEAGVRQVNQMAVSTLLAATYTPRLSATDACVNVNAEAPVAVDGSLWVRFKITASPVALEFGEIKLTFTN